MSETLMEIEIRQLQEMAYRYGRVLEKSKEEHHERGEDAVS